MNTSAKVPAARLEARVPADVYDKLKRAASLEGRTLTDFVVDAARAAADRTIAEATTMRVSLADYEAISAAIADPPEPAEALRRAFDRHRALIRRVD